MLRDVLLLTEMMPFCVFALWIWLGEMKQVPAA